MGSLCTGDNCFSPSESASFAYTYFFCGVPCAYAAIAKKLEIIFCIPCELTSKKRGCNGYSLSYGFTNLASVVNNLPDALPKIILLILHLHIIDDYDEHGELR
jgi:hypothetical protein